MKLAAWAVLSVLAGPAFADDPIPAQPPATRQASVAVGLGNTVPGIGVSVEKYISGGQASIFGGAGYVPDSYDGRGAKGAAVAAGLRAYTRGRKHRAFAELSISPVAVEVAPEGSGLRGRTISYGSSLSVGYNMVTHGGFTLALSTGVGQAMTGAAGAHGTEFVSSIALGHTWARH